MASIGERIVQAMATVNHRVGDGEIETFNNPSMKAPPEFQEQLIRLWEAIGSAIVGATEAEIFREVRIYDGSPKRSEPTETHVDNFIPEEEFNEMLDPDYETPYGRNKTDDTEYPVYNLIPDPPEILEFRRGYRVIITDEFIQKNSIVRYQIEYLDRNLENDIPETYNHVSPGNVAIVNKEDGEIQFSFENKGAYFIRYGIWNGPRNEDSEPEAIPYEDTVP